MKPDDLRQKVKDLAMTGAKATDIAATLSISVSRVRGYICRMVEANEIPPVVLRRRPGTDMQKKRPARAAAYKFTARFGRIDELFAGLTEEQADWLVSQIPPGCLLIDVIRAIIIDAYEEDMET